MVIEPGFAARAKFMAVMSTRSVALRKMVSLLILHMVYLLPNETSSTCKI